MRTPASPYQTIHLHRDAPPKPAVGAACNGCGVCCAMAPCPIGMLISRRRNGRCSALMWQDDAGRYACGVLTGAEQLGGGRWPGLARIVRAWAARSISAGSGCDADIEAVGEARPPPSDHPDGGTASESASLG